MLLNQMRSRHIAHRNTQVKWEELYQGHRVQVTLRQHRMEAVWGIKLQTLGILDLELL
jgi:hypothetical protein